MRRLALALALVCLAAHGEEPPPAGLFGSPGHFTEPTGADVYRGVCAGCHMANGQGAVGAGAYPSLVGDPRLAVATYPIAVVLRGQGGMPGFARTLSDAQVAEVVGFIRKRFGDGGAAPSAAEVAAAR